MASKKGVSSTRNGRDSNPQYLGIKRFGGQEVNAGEILDEVKGPKIDILRYKNKTGYRRRQGFRAQHTRVKITAISGAN